MTRPYMRMYWGDYHRDTQDLSTVEHGAYLLLISHYWAHGPLPNDPEILARVTKLTCKKFAKYWKNLARFFHLENGFFVHGRIDEEITKANDIKEKRREAGRQGGRPQKANASLGESTPLPLPFSEPKLTTKPLPPNGGSPPLGEIDLTIPDDLRRKQPDGKPKRGTRLADDWQPTAEDRAYAEQRGFSGAEIDDIAANFRTYWTAGAGRNKTHLRWSGGAGAWGNWVRKERPAGGGNGAGRSGRDPPSVVAALGQLRGRT